MEPRAHHVIIGLFTIAALAAALLFALWLGKSSADREWAYYQVGFDHAVSGLAEGSPVLYSGIRVGDVVELRLDPDNPSHVRALVRVYREVPIRADTHVELVLANITGRRSVQFGGGTPGQPILQGDRDDPPLIIAEPSAFSSLLSNGEALVEKADRLLTNANALFSDDNIDNLTAVLANARSATESLLAHRDNVATLIEQLRAAGERAETAAIKVSRVSDRTDQTLTQRVEPVLDAMATALATLQPTLDRLNRLTLENEGALDAGLQGMGELTPALREMRSTLRNLNQLTRRLERDPAGALLGTPTIKELEP